MPDIVTFFLPGFRFSQEFTVVFDKKNETFFFLLKAVNVYKHWGRNVYGLVPQKLVVGTQNKKIVLFLCMLFFVVQFSSFFFNLRPCQDCKLLTMFSWYKLSQLMKTFFFFTKSFVLRYRTDSIDTSFLFRLGKTLVFCVAAIHVPSIGFFLII